MSEKIWYAVVAATAVVCLGLGWLAGWVSHRQYLISELESAFGEFEQDLDEALDEETWDEAEWDELAEEPEPEEVTIVGGAPEPDSDTDGVFSYAIVGVGTAGSYTNDWDDTSHASDTYVILSVAAENVGDGPGEPASDADFDTVIGYDADGRSYHADSEVWADVGLDELNPGQSAEYDIVFDVPDGVEFVAVELGAYDAPGVAVIEVG